MSAWWRNDFHPPGDKVSTDVGIIGADGQLGRDVVRVFSASERFKVIPFTHRDLEITAVDSLETILDSHRPGILINTAAYHRRDAEIQPEKTLTVNALGPAYLALTCRRFAIDLVHISTDFVFSGQARTPYPEQAETKPGTLYGYAKLLGELAVKRGMDNYYIIRTAGLYGIGGCRAKNNSNFVEGILEKAQQGESLNVVSDQVCTPTSTADLATALLELVQTKAYGTYHITNSGHCSWYEFAREILRLSGLEVPCHPVRTADEAAGVIKPRYTVLANLNLRAAGLKPLRPWPEALQAYLVERQYTQT